MQQMNDKELRAVESYLRKAFRTEGLTVKKPPRKNDLAEVFIAEEFIATLYRDDEDGEVTWQLNMPILQSDLEL